jgi:hypothetical protein
VFGLVVFEAEKLYQTTFVLLVKTTDFAVYMLIAKHQHSDYQQYCGYA